jgi:hypothetical protein
MAGRHQEKTMPHLSQRFPSSLRWLAGAALALLLASPLAAYTIYLKNGQTIQAKGKYRIQNGKALIVLSNGTQSSINASEIDVARTDAENKSDYGGNAVILDQGTPGKDQAATPPPQKKLSDLIASRQAARELPGARRDMPVKEAPKGPSKTKAGYNDLSVAAHRPYGQADVLAELQQFFHGQGIDDVEIYAGTQGEHPLIEVTTASEGSVFRALSIAANALLHVRDRFPNKVAAFELVMMTPTRERAGQFLLLPDMASDLVAKKVEPTAFYVQNVQF